MSLLKAWKSLFQKDSARDCRNNLYRNLCNQHEEMLKKYPHPGVLRARHAEIIAGEKKLRDMGMYIPPYLLLLLKFYKIAYSNEVRN